MAFSTNIIVRHIAPSGLSCEADRSSLLRGAKKEGPVVFAYGPLGGGKITLCIGEAATSSASSNFLQLLQTLAAPP